MSGLADSNPRKRPKTEPCPSCGSDDIRWSGSTGDSMLVGLCSACGVVVTK